VTSRAWFIVTVHAPGPLQAPLHPAKALPGAGTAVSVTTVFIPKCWEHVPPQLIPAGLLVMAPAPEPLLLTVKVYSAEGTQINVTAPVSAA
jgi:hypothetical protein